jgi:hypothetical protein
MMQRYLNILPKNADQDRSLAELVAKLVYKIWSRPSPQSEENVSDFISFVLKIISLSNPNMSPSVILTSLLYVKRLRIATKLQIPLGSKCEYRIWLTALMYFIMIIF